MSQNMLLLPIITCFAAFTSVVLAETHQQDASALNELYKSLNSPSKLKGWESSGGDPCDDSWDGITCKGSSVSEIKLSGLGLSGSMGYQLSNLKSVTHLDLSKNNLNGNVPYQLPPNLVYLDLSENDFNGDVPYSISLMNDLNYLNLGHNKLNGDLSDMFQKLPKLETIDLSFNQLSGKLPESFANLTNLKTLYLQDNQLKGSINVLRDLPHLDDLNVANNWFTGWIPDELKDIGNIETEGNHWSTGKAPPPPPGTHHTRQDSGDNGMSKTVVTGVLIAAAAFGALILVSGTIAFVSRKRPSPSSHFIDEERGGSQHSRPPFTPQLSRKLHYDAIDSYKGQKIVDSDASVDTKAALQRNSAASSYKPATARVPSAKQSSGTRPMEPFALADLQDATSGFAPARLLGEGSIGRVYKAKHADGRILAVKEIDSSLLDGGNPEEFLSIVSNISRIRHPNIAELVGYCSAQGRNLLVYEYFRSGSIHAFLHLSENFSRPLTWQTRIRIALGTARAVEYLHETCSPPLVHKNIKSSNILLDPELNPHLADYGLANFHHRTSQNLGAGYNAPECITPSAYTLKSDVYSFGVVMLELLTGRMPYDSTRPKSEQSLVRWATPQLHDMEALENYIVDPALCGLYPPESVSRFADIISLCVKAEPELRPPVSKAVEELAKLDERSNTDLKEELLS